MANNFKKLLELAKKTGDNCIVLDEEGNPSYVLVGFDDYQKMVLNRSQLAGLSESELLDKINQDIAVWKASTQNESLDNWQIIQSAVGELNKNKEVVESSEKSLNQAKNFVDTNDSDLSNEKYYFEPVD